MAAELAASEAARQELALRSRALETTNRLLRLQLAETTSSFRAAMATAAAAAAAAATASAAAAARHCSRLHRRSRRYRRRSHSSRLVIQVVIRVGVREGKKRCQRGRHYCCVVVTVDDRLCPMRRMTSVVSMSGRSTYDIRPARER